MSISTFYVSRGQYNAFSDLQAIAVQEGWTSKWKEPVRVATTTNGTLATAYENGDTVDGIVLATGDRILLKDQTTGSENGIYTVNASGSPTRAIDFDGDLEVVGSVTKALEGTANGAKYWQMTNTGTVIIGSTALTFIEFGTGGGVSFPIIPPVSVRGNVSTNQDINLSATNAHSTTMTLTGNISITFSSFPATANQIEWEIEIKQDATGGRTVGWPAAVTPVPVIDSTANATTIVVLRTNDAGTIIRTLLAGTGTGGGEVFVWSANHNASGFSLIDGRIADATDATKILDFNLAGMTTGITGVFDINFTTAKTITFSDAVGTVVLSPLQLEFDFNTFNGEKIDSLLFMSTAGSLGSLDVGLSSLGSGGFRANVLNTGQFKIEKENVDRVVFDMSTNFAIYKDMGIRVEDVTSGDTLQFTTTAALAQTSSTNDHRFVRGGVNIFDVTSTGIAMIGTSFITTPQIGFSFSGNIIESDATGMKLKTAPGDDFEFSDGTDIFGTHSKLLFAINSMSMQYTKIATPADPGSITLGKVFFNTSSNRLNFRRRNDGDTAWIDVDLEGVATGANAQLSNLSGTVAVNLDLDPATTNVRDFGSTSLRWNGAFIRSLNITDASGLGLVSDLVPGTNSTYLLGTVTRRFLSISTDKIGFSTSTTLIRDISGEISIESPTNISFKIGGIAAGKISSTSLWDFENATLDGVAQVTFEDGHTISSNPSNLLVNLATNDEFVLQDNGTQFASFGDTITDLKFVSTGTLGHNLAIGLDSSSPADLDTLGILSFKGRDSSNNFQDFANIQAFALDVTSGTEDGLVRHNVWNNGSQAKVLEMSASGGNVQMGFWGDPAVAQQTVASDTLSNLYTALRASGIIG